MFCASFMLMEVVKLPSPYRDKTNNMGVLTFSTVVITTGVAAIPREMFNTVFHTDSRTSSQMSDMLKTQSKLKFCKELKL